MKRADLVILLLIIFSMSYCVDIPYKITKIQNTSDVAAINHNFDEISINAMDKRVYDIDNNGVIDNSSNGNPIGTVLAYISTTAPTGYLYCNGQAVSRTTYANLYAIIGNTFGQGDGSTTFNLPDFRGRFLRGMDNGAGRDIDISSRTAMATGGNTGDKIGSVEPNSLQYHSHNWLRPTSVTRADTGTYTDSMYNTMSGASFESGWIANAGGSETRPINANVSYIIKY